MKGFVRLISLALAISSVFAGSPNGAGESYTLAEKNGYALRIEVIPGKKDSYAVLIRQGFEVGRDEDVHRLLQKCEDRGAWETLTDAFIQREIRENGGEIDFQKIADANMRNFGGSFYSHLGRDVIKAYRRNGIYLEAK